MEFYQNGCRCGYLSVDRTLSSVKSMDCGDGDRTASRRYRVLKRVFRVSFILAFFVAARVFLRSPADTSLEILALRQQVAVLKRRESTKKSGVQGLTD